MSTAAGGVPHPYTLCSQHRDWGDSGGVPACPDHALAGGGLSPWPPLLALIIRARVPSVYRSFGCQDGSWGCG